MTTDPTPDFPTNAPEQTNAPTPPEPAATSEETPASPAEERRRRLIGSQRDLGAAEPRKRDWYVPEEKSEAREPTKTPKKPAAAPQATAPPVAPIEPPAVAPDSTPVEAAAPADEPVAARKHFPPPNIRDRLPPELEDELEQAMSNVAIDDLMDGSEAVTSATLLEPDSKFTGHVVAVSREDVFVELGGREQGTVPLRQFAEPPEPGAELTVAVVRFNAEEGFYELRLPGAAANVGDWSDIEEGMTVEVMVTGHNAGGLECEVNHIRGFIPISQISLYRVEDLAQFVGQKMTCVVTEANPERRNLVVSRRAVLEREREEARRTLFESLAPGQVHEGIVRKLMDFGAFVDLGSGVDGLLHVSELGWGRVHHPSQVLEEGQRIKVRILKVNPENRRISLGYRDMLANPWDDVGRKYPVNTVVTGKVVKLMDFGAFVELEPGIEGLVHISELDHKRVWRVADVVAEGQEVEVLVKSIDKENQRISLSIKDAKPPAEPEKKEEPTEDQVAAASPKPIKRQKPKKLQGGLGRSKGGDRFGLQW
jgi:predicted RNA-binding protein with RPS1 domain